MSIPVQRGKKYRFVAEGYVYGVSEDRVELCAQVPSVTFGEEERSYGPQGQMGYLPGAMLAEDPLEIIAYEPGSMWLYGAEGAVRLVLVYAPSWSTPDSREHEDTERPWVLANSDPQRRFRPEEIESRYLTPLKPQPGQDPSI